MDSQTVPERNATLISALTRPECYPHPVDAVEQVETHISWVLLAGDYAYKIKKPVDLGFLDFSTLAKRRFYCEEELRLNRRTAPRYYLGVVPITGNPSRPRMGGAGEALEYAVQMRRFPQSALLGQNPTRLRRGHIDRLARLIADFHRSIATASPETAFGLPETVYRPVEQNFEQIRSRIDDPPRRERLLSLAHWSQARFAAQRDVFLQRRQGGFVRECHGDLHLGNIALIDDDPLLFDCIEFNENLRWIDVMSELAFVTMDLCKQGLATFARRLRNGYLEWTGDYAGLPVLRFYQVYRAMVRAKIAAIRLSQEHSGKAQWQEYDAYVELAHTFTEPQPPFLLITHGLSGSGKTSGCMPLIEEGGAIRLRSDVERKRLFGLEPEADSGSALGSGIYTPQAAIRTYDRLGELAQTTLRAGYPAIVDATFLKRDQRERFRALAERLNVPFGVLHFQASRATLDARIRQRREAGHDASEADSTILARQLATIESLTPDETAVTVTVNSESPVAEPSLLRRFHALWG